VRTNPFRPGLAIAVALTLVCPAIAAAAEITHTISTRAADVRVERSPDGDRIRVPGSFQDPTDPGAVMLPYRVVNLLLPPGETVATFDVNVGAGLPIATSVAPATVPDIEDEKRGNGPAKTALGADGDMPSARAVYLGTGTLHGHAIASFAVYPLELADGSLALHESVTLRVSTTAADPSRTVVTRARFREGFRAGVSERVAGLVANPFDLSLYADNEVRVARKAGGFVPATFPSLEGSDVDYVIVTNDSLAESFQVLADWKTAKGVPTVVRTTEWIAANYRNGVDLAETVRNFVKDAYQYWGVSYVLLGGDVAQVPVRFGSSFFFGNKDVPVDMYFGCLDGDWNADHDEYFGEGGVVDATDLYQEVYVGRLPASNNFHAQTMVSKVMTYETAADPSYTGKVLLLAEVLFPIDWNGVQQVVQDGAGIAEFVRLLALTDPSLTVDRHYENHVPYPGAVDETRAGALAAINAGYDHVNDIGHGFRFNMSVGDASIVNADADALTNAGRYCNLYLLNCTAVAYTYFCLGEHFLLNPNGGAVSVVGANESAYPQLSQPYMNEYYDLVFNDDVVNIGEAFVRSREIKTGIAQQADNGDLWTHYVYSILADPEMPLWTAPVQPLSVSVPAGVGFGTSSITVHVTDAGGPVANARVCLSKGTEDYEVGTTDGNGDVTLAMTVESAGSIRVVATAFNRARTEATIPVNAAGGAWIAFADGLVEDDPVGGTSGNANGMIDAGETFDFTASVTNTGTANASNVTLTLRSPNTGVSIIDSVANVGNVNTGATKSALDAFRVSLASWLPDRVPVTFVLVASQNGTPLWTDRFVRLVHAPALEFEVIRIDDTATGNSDGLVQANEQFRLHYRVKNYGTGTANGVTATLTDQSGFFVITAGSDAYPALDTATGDENTSGFLLLETDVSGPHDLRMDVTDVYGRVWSKVFELRPPAAPSGILFDPSLGPDRLQLYWDAPAGATDVNRYRVLRSVSSSGPFAESTLDPVLHTVFIDTGLQPTTRYYYQVAAVDVSGNTGVFSATASGSTNPTQLTGWPIAMAAETVSSPVVGDIDGDFDFELVAGNTKLYAWHDDGVEVRDADGNAQTWGLFSTLGNNFVSAPALAPIDNLPGLDILAASRDTKEVYAFNHTGAVIAGWPRPVQNAIRAAVVAGDINNDGNKEVIALDEKGVLYVWNRNGTEYRNGDNNPATQGIFRRFGNCVYQYTCPAIADLDSDGFNEIVVGTQGDSVFVLNENGSSVPGWPRAFTSDISGSIAIGDTDDNGDLELVICDYAGNVRLYNHDGTQAWAQFFQNSLAFGPSPALGDLDNDGKLEIVIPSKNRNLYVMRWNGTSQPGFPVVYTASGYTESSPVIADIDYDGFADILLGDESRYVNAWNRNGQPLAGFPLAIGDAVRATPVIADFDKDGNVDVIAVGWDKSVYVWDFPRMFDPLNAPWSKYHGNLYNDGNIATPLPTPVRDATFLFSALDGGFELAWQVPSAGESRFAVERAEVTNGEPDAYRRVATDLSVGPDGNLRLTDRGLKPGSRYAYRLLEDGGTVHETAGLYVPVLRAALGQNFPNPFNPVTKIEYWVPDGSRGSRMPVSLDVYDVRGAHVRSLVRATQVAGRYEAAWDGRDDAGAPVGSGIYFYKYRIPGFTDARKMVLLK